MTDHDHIDPAQVDLPPHLNDRDGIISIFLMAIAILLLLLLVVAVVQAI